MYRFEISVTPNQIERLYSRFTSLDRGDCGTLSRDDLLRIPEIAINPLGERIVNSFFQEDGFSDRLNFRQFLYVLAHFRPIKKNKDNKLNSREQKLRCEFLHLPFRTDLNLKTITIYFWHIKEKEKFKYIIPCRGIENS